MYDTQLDLEKALKETPPSKTDDLCALEDHQKVSSSAIILQQAEAKKGVIQSLLSPKTTSALKSMEGILDERSAAVVTRFLASSRTLSRSFDMYLQKVLNCIGKR